MAKHWIWKVGPFHWFFLHDFTLFVIDMHQKRSISLFPTPFGHFHFHPFPALIWWVDLRRCHYQHHHHCHGDHKHVHQHDHNHHHFHSHHHSHHHHYHDHRRREELKQLSRDRRERMYVWIRITRCFFIVSTMILKLVLFIITVFIIIIVSFFIMMIRSSNKIWLWLPNLPNLVVVAKSPQFGCGCQISPRAEAIPPPCLILRGFT